MFTGIPAAAQPGGRVVVWALRLFVFVGVIAILVGWAQASNSVEVSSQIDWAPLGLAGATLVAAALLGSVLVARQAVAIRMSHLAPYIAEPSVGSLAAATAAGSTAATTGAGSAAVSTGPRAAVVAGAAESLVAAESMARFHRASCALTAGKPVRPQSRQAHEQAGRRPCGVCAP